MKWILDDNLVEKLYQQTTKTEKKDEAYLIDETYGHALEVSYAKCPLMSSDFYLQLNRKICDALIEHNQYIINLTKEEFLVELINKLELIKMKIDTIFERIQNDKFEIESGYIAFINANIFFSSKEQENIFYIEFLNLFNIFNSVEITIKDNDINFKIIEIKDSTPELQTMVEIITHNKDILFSDIKSKFCNDFIESFFFLQQIRCKMFEKGISDNAAEKLFENFKGYYFKNKQDIMECIDKIYLEKDIKIDF